MSTNKQKIIVVLGQTATGKSDLGVQFAKKIGGEIISADSRQVYTGLDIGTGKITKKEMRGIPHYLLDIVNPKHMFTAAEFNKLAEKKIEEILRRGKVPIIVGGTGFYINILLGEISFPNVPPDKKLRAVLEKKTTIVLLKQLEKLNPVRLKNIDVKNRRRIIRAIEIAKTQTNADYTHTNADKNKLKYDVLKIGIKIDNAILKKNIKKRLVVRMKQGMAAEARKLHKKGLSWKRMEELGLEYRYLSRYLRGKISKQEMIGQLNTAIWQYARRQKTWFKRDKNIHWIKANEYKKIKKELQKFLKK